MKELNRSEIIGISGGKFKLHLDVGKVVSGAALGFISGGVVGLGYAIGAAIVSQGIDSLLDM